MDINTLYRQVIMQHYSDPKNKGLINDSSYLTIHLNNPSCGDDLIVQVKFEEDVISDVRHLGKGCSICCSSASVMSESLKGKKKSEAILIINEFYELVKGNEFKKELFYPDMLAYGGVSKFPARIKCATLAWKAIEKGILNGSDNNEWKNWWYCWGI